MLLLILLAGLSVHEWGVIVQEPVLLTGTSGGVSQMLTVPDCELEDRAPVVYFHGEPCFIDLRITFPSMGYATALMPQADQGGINSTYATWNRLELTDAPGESLSEGWPSVGSTGFPAPVWRRVDALDVAAYGSFDRFLYYECVPGSPGDLPFMNQSGNRSIRMPYGEIPCIVLTVSEGRPMYGTFTLADIVTSIPKGLQFLDEPEVLRRELWRWAEGVLAEDEFQAFWNTWESAFLEDCSERVMILYPVPREVMDEIACIEIVPDGDFDVELKRFIVAELPYR